MSFTLELFSLDLMFLCPVARLGLLQFQRRSLTVRELDSIKRRKFLNAVLIRLHNVLLNPSRVLYSLKWSVYLYFCSIQSYEEDDTLILTYQACLGSFLGYTYDDKPLAYKAVRPHLGLEGLWGRNICSTDRLAATAMKVKALTMVF